MCVYLFIYFAYTYVCICVSILTFDAFKMILFGIFSLIFNFIFFFVLFFLSFYQVSCFFSIFAALLLAMLYFYYQYIYTNIFKLTFKQKQSTRDFFQFFVPLEYIYIWKKILRNNRKRIQIVTKIMRFLLILNSFKFNHP